MPGPVFGSTGDITYIGKLNTLSASLITNDVTQSANFTGVRGFRYPVDTDGLTITLPLAPAGSDSLAVFSIASSAKKITFSRNGQNIEGAAADKVITKDGFHYIAVFVNATFGWKIFDLTPAPAAARRNLVINPNFDVAQRGATYALTTAVAYGSVDRWGFKMAGTAAGIANQVDAQAQGFVGYKNCLKLGRNSGSALTGVISAQTAFETVDSEKWQGKNVAVTLAIKAGANFSGTGLSIKLFTGKGVDQSLVSMEAGTWTSSATPVSVNQAITTTPTDYTFTVALPNDITQIGFQASYTPVGTAGADDNVYITGVDISEGTVAPPREFRHYPYELQLCRWYYRRVVSNAGNNAYFAVGGCNSATAALVPATIAAAMRATPTLGFSAVGDIGGFVNGGNTALTGLTIAFAPEAPLLNATVAAGFVTGQACVLNVASGTGKYVDFSAEL